jgi:N-acyl-D-aspartate/D-glutamate deacylase
VTSLKLSQCRLVVTMDDHGTEVPDATIAIRDGWITAVGSEPSEEQFDQVIDGRRPHTRLS